jgi:hypothetical protein
MVGYRMNLTCASYGVRDLSDDELRSLPLVGRAIAYDFPKPHSGNFRIQEGHGEKFSNPIQPSRAEKESRNSICDSPALVGRVGRAKRRPGWGSTGSAFVVYPHPTGLSAGHPDSSSARIYPTRGRDKEETRLPLFHMQSRCTKGGESALPSRRPVLLLQKLRRRLPRHLPERMRKRREAGIAQIGGELLQRGLRVHRQPFDSGRDAGALAPALETELGLA